MVEISERTINFDAYLFDTPEYIRKHMVIFSKTYFVTTGPCPFNDVTSGNSHLAKAHIGAY